MTLTKPMRPATFKPKPTATDKRQQALAVALARTMGAKK